MKKRTVLLILFLAIQALHAGLFEGRYPSARATAMSDAYVAVAGDVWSTYYNPAGLARLGNYQVASAIQRPFNRAFFSNGFFGAGAPLPGKFGSVAVAFETFGVTYDGNNLSNETTLTLSHGFYLMQDIHSALSVGYNLKYYHWSLGQSVGGLDLGSGNAFGLDVGLQASVYQRTFVGVYAYNINAPTMGSRTRHDLPQRLVVGAAYMPVTGITTSLAFDKTVGFDTQLQGGFEFLPLQWLALRLGASTQPNRFSAGIGINYHGIHLDYSFHTHPVLPETHKFSLMYQFGK